MIKLEDGQYYCKMVLDSIGPVGKRLSTVEIRYPRFIHSEILTHRDRCRNSASSRAIPWPKMKERIINYPVIPIYWGSNQKGMQTGEEISEEKRDEANRIWLEARDFCVKAAEKLHELGVHKSLVNRVTEPWMWITVVMSATEWKNFFRLRCHPDAEIHFQKIAGMIREALNQSVPQQLRVGEYHLPYIEDDDIDLIRTAKEEYLEYGILYLLKRCSTARCARVSYTPFDSDKKNILEDLRIAKQLIERSDDVIHASPLENVAQCCDTLVRSGPFIGWKQFRKEFANENVEG
jgi:hypothetical protein